MTALTGSKSIAPARDSKGVAYERGNRAQRRQFIKDQRRHRHDHAPIPPASFMGTGPGVGPLKVSRIKKLRFALARRAWRIRRGILSAICRVLGHNTPAVAGLSSFPGQGWCRRCMEIVPISKQGFTP